MSVTLFNSLFRREVTMLDSTKLQCAVYGDPYSGEKESLLCDDGELSSTIEIFGYGQPMLHSALVSKVTELSRGLNTFFKQQDKRLIATYYNDPDDNDYVTKTRARYDRNCEVVRLNLADIHQAELRKIQALTRTDRFFLTVETGKKSIEQTDYDRSEKGKVEKINELFKKLGIVSKYTARMNKPQKGQNPMHFNSELFHAHQNNVVAVEDLIKQIGSRCEVVGAKDTLRFMHKVFNRDAGVDWQPITTPQTEEEIEADIERQFKLENILPINQRKASYFSRVGNGEESYSKEYDIADLLLPPLVTQIVGDDAEILEDGVISINGKFYKTMYVDVPQQKLESFDKFIRGVDDIPFMMSWHLDSNESGINGALSRGSMIGMARVISQSCKDIQRAAHLLKSYKKDDIKAMAMYRLAIVTWAGGDNAEGCLRRANTLKEKFSRWGTSQVLRCEKANPVQSMIEVFPSMAKPEINRAYPCLVEEALYQMPFSRISSPWSKGMINFIQAVDKTIYPVNVGEKQQNFPRAIIVGPTGYGKTFLKNSMLMNALFREDYHKIPLLAMCTIGYDGKLFADTIRSALPKEQHHLIISDKPKLTTDYAVNIFDTAYGARYPREVEIENIVGFLEQCLAEQNTARLPQDLAAVLRNVVIYSFQYFADDSPNAKSYSKGANREIDAYFDENNIKDNVRRGWTWWDAFDYFHDLGDTRMAYLCQIQAMPNIGDLVPVMSENQSIFDDARDAKIDTMSIADIFKRRIMNLQSTYKNLCVPTRYNIESARVIIFDLESVCPKGSLPNQPETQNDRTAALMYQLYFMFQTKKFMIPMEHEDFLSDTRVPKKYHQYHFDIIDGEKGIPKIFDVDEKHRASKAYNFNTELERIVREMRKYGAAFSGASQLPTDWEKSLISNIGAIFIMHMDATTESEKDTYRDLFGFNEEEFKIAKDHLKGLHPKYGQPFLLLIKSIDGETGRSLVPLYHCASSEKLWAIGASKINHDFRSELQNRLKDANHPNPVLAARGVLSRVFKSGGIDNIVDAEMKLYPNKTIQTIRTELINKCLKLVLEETTNA